MFPCICISQGDGHLKVSMWGIGMGMRTKQKSWEKNSSRQSLVLSKHHSLSKRLCCPGPCVLTLQHAPEPHGAKGIRVCRGTTSPWDWHPVSLCRTCACIQCPQVPFELLHNLYFQGNGTKIQVVKLYHSLCWTASVSSVAALEWCWGLWTGLYWWGQKGPQGWTRAVIHGAASIWKLPPSPVECPQCSSDLWTCYARNILHKSRNIFKGVNRLTYKDIFPQSSSQWKYVIFS